jgi:plasmid stabilization system protein ParE
LEIAWTVGALNDLDRIQDFIARDSPTNAFRFASEMVTRADCVLALNPQIGRTGRVAGTREWVVPKTSYIIVYRVGSRIELLAVMHAARLWPDRF